LPKNNEKSSSAQEFGGPPNREALAAAGAIRSVLLTGRQLKQEAPLLRRAQRVRRAELVYYFMTFLGENLLLANQPFLRNWPRKIPNSTK